MPLPTIEKAAADTKLTYETANHHSAGKKVTALIEPPLWHQFSDSTLPERYRDALERLERLLYVASGSAPKSDSEQWYIRQHPRCYWIAENVKEEWCGEGGGTPFVADCNDAHSRLFYETAAKGEHYSSGSMSPQVPLRSASGDPAYQFATRINKTSGLKMTVNAEHFPRTSVVRDTTFTSTPPVYTTFWNGDTLFDPKGSGTFGGDPSLDEGTDGDDTVTGDTVEIRYTPPAGKTVISAQMKCIAGPALVNMANVAGVWKGTFPAQAHNVAANWYLKVTFDNGDEPDYVKYHPGDDTEPTTVNDTFYFVWYTHYQPYARGMPELLSKARKGTQTYDGYKFKPDESVDHRLLNLARYCCQYLGNLFHHPPSLRPAGIGTCCLNWHITFWWTASSQYPFYKSGGKDGIHPLHDNDFGTYDDHEAYRLNTWRGYPTPYGNTYNWQSWWYPAGQMEASWLTPPQNVSQLVNYPDTAICSNHWDGQQRGLQHGDTIDAIHIEEVIAAIDYLVNGGLWLKAPIKRRPKTPKGTFIDGLSCGHYHETFSGDPSHDRTGYIGDVNDFYRGDCFNDPPIAWCSCCWFHPDGASGDDWCVDYPAPDDWNDCWNATTKHSEVDDADHGWGFGLCPIEEHHFKQCSSIDFATWGGTFERWEVKCGGGNVNCPCNSCGDLDQNPAGVGVSDKGCGSVYLQEKNKHSGEDEGVSKLCDSRVCGWEYWLCGPDQSPDGPPDDTNHGNSVYKNRSNFDCDILSSGGGVPYSMGNKLGQSYSCAYTVDDISNYVGFESVVSVRWRGLCDAWNGWCDDLCGDVDVSSCITESELPSAAGLPDRYDWFGIPSFDGLYKCSHGCNEVGDPIVNRDTETACSIKVPDECDEDKIWVAIALNLQDNRMPELFDYNLASATLQTDCPCLTSGDPQTAETCV